jgi:hypothetical protein
MVWIGLVALVAGSVACADDDDPTGPADKVLEFSLSAPSSVPTKQQVEVEIRITQAALVNYPLTVTFEESNVDQPYALVATKILQKPEDTTERISEEAARDPVYRVTVCEAGSEAARLCVEKTVQVDVVDFP